MYSCKLKTTISQTFHRCSGRPWWCGWGRVTNTDRKCRLVSSSTWSLPFSCATCWTWTICSAYGRVRLFSTRTTSFVFFVFTRHKTVVNEHVKRVCRQPWLLHGSHVNNLKTITIRVQKYLKPPLMEFVLFFSIWKLCIERMSMFTMWHDKLQVIMTFWKIVQ